MSPSPELIMSLGAVEDRCARLASLPERGNIPRERLSFGIGDCCKAQFKPLRIIYRVLGAEVVIYCVAEGRRDMRSFLERRLLR